MKLPISESTDTEFKKIADAVSSEDIVAFANSAVGGVVIVGIAENKNSATLSPSDIVGCDIRDSEKQKLLSKAQSCIPPVSIDVSIEMISGMTCLLVKIPSSKSRPHCTRKGTYTVRGDSRTNPLAPDQLLSLFLEKEGSNFLSRFQSATRSLEIELKGISTTVRKEVSEVLSFLGDFDSRIEASLEEVGGLASSAQSAADDVGSELQSSRQDAESTEERVAKSLDELQEKVNAILLKQQPDALPIDIVKRDYCHLLSLGLFTAGSTKRARDKRFQEIVPLLLEKRPYLSQSFLKECYDQLKGSRTKRKIREPRQSRNVRRGRSGKA